MPEHVAHAESILELACYRRDLRTSADEDDFEARKLMDAQRR